MLLEYGDGGQAGRRGGGGLVDPEKLCSPEAEKSFVLRLESSQVRRFWLWVGVFLGL